MVHCPAIRHVPCTMYTIWLLIKLCDKKMNVCLLEYSHVAFLGHAWQWKNPTICVFMLYTFNLYPKSWFIWRLMRHHITCHLPCPVYPNSATTVARTSQESSACLKACIWSISVGEQRRDLAQLCNVCDKAVKTLPTPKENKIWQHSGHVFVCQGCGKKFNHNNSINIQKKLVCDKPHHRKSFCHFSMWGPLLTRSSPIWTWGGRRRGRKWFWPATGWWQTSSTILNGNLFCWF